MQLLMTRELPSLFLPLPFQPEGGGEWGPGRIPVLGTPLPPDIDPGGLCTNRKLPGEEQEAAATMWVSRKRLGGPLPGGHPQGQP